MLDIVGTFSPRVEYYSIDEFFFGAEPLARGQPPTRTVTAIRDHIQEAASLPVTIGVARTRTHAKLFSDTAKPFGAVAVLDRDHERALVSAARDRDQRHRREEGEQTRAVRHPNLPRPG